MAWKREDYFYLSLKEKPISEVRKEYTRFRKEFNKHLKAGFGEWYANRAFRINPYPTIKEISSGLSAEQTNSQIMHNLAEMKNLSMSTGYTAAGRRKIRQQAIDTLSALGAKSFSYEDNRKNIRNFEKFIQFAEYFEDTFGMKYTSDALTVFDTVLSEKGDLDKMYANFDRYVENVSKFDQIRSLPDKKRRKALKKIEQELD